MNIKILSKLNIFLVKVFAFSQIIALCYFINIFTKFLLTFSFFAIVSSILMNLAPNHEADILINNLLFQVIFYFSTIYFLTFIIVFCLMLMSDKLIEYINKQYFYFYVSSDKINILHHLFVRNHSSSKLNLELRKLSESIKNKSNLYSKLSKNDFPQINKLFRRLGYHYHQKEKNQNTTLNFVDNDDLVKLNKYKKQDMLPSSILLTSLTLDDMDEELNHLINNQFKELKINNKV